MNAGQFYQGPRPIECPIELVEEVFTLGAIRDVEAGEKATTSGRFSIC